MPAGTRWSVPVLPHDSITALGKDHGLREEWVDRPVVTGLGDREWGSGHLHRIHLCCPCGHNRSHSLALIPRCWPGLPPTQATGKGSRILPAPGHPLVPTPETQ